MPRTILFLGVKAELTAGEVDFGRESGRDRSLTDD